MAHLSFPNVSKNTLSKQMFNASELDTTKHGNLEFWGIKPRTFWQLYFTIFCTLLLLFSSFWALESPALSFQIDTATIRYVAESGSDDDNNCSLATVPCLTLQQAIDQAQDGDEIRVASGNYNNEATISVDGRSNLKIRGGYSINSWTNPSETPNPTIHQTIINANANGRVFRINQANNITLEGLYITGGTSSNGGGLLIEDSEIIVIQNTHIYNNQATQEGGGIALVASKGITLQTNYIYDNQVLPAQDGGGGGILAFNASAFFDANIIYNNQAPSGGALHHEVGQDDLSTTSILQNNIIYDNKAIKFQGGAIYNVKSDLIIWNNTIIENTAATKGGGIYNSDFRENSNVIISNTIIMGNQDSDSGAGDGVFNDNISGDYDDNTVTIAYSYIPDSTTNITTIQNPISLEDTSNIFVDTANRDYHLSDDSPLRDVGDPNTSVKTDIDGQARPFRDGFDVGADEVYGGTCFVYLSVNDTDVMMYDEETSTNPIQDAIDAAQDGNLVKVAGACTQAQTKNGETQIVYLDKNITLRGGYTNSNWMTPEDNPTYLRGDGSHRILFIAGNISPTIENFYIAGGGASQGAGIYLSDQASPIIQNNVFYDNSATGNGGGIYNTQGHPTIRFNTFYNNTAADFGGAIYDQAGRLALEHNIFLNNKGAGSALYTSVGSPTIQYNAAFPKGSQYASPPDNSLFQGDDSEIIVNNHNLFVDSKLADPANGDFSLNFDSPVINQGATQVLAPDMDLQGDPRILGGRADIGADESTAFPGVSLRTEQLGSAPPGGMVRIVHTLKNIGNIDDVYDITHRINRNWTVRISPDRSALSADEMRNIAVEVDIPGDAPEGIQALLVITATSQRNNTFFDVLIDTMQVQFVPGAELSPSVVEDSGDPGESFSITHILTNTASATDSYVLKITPASDNPDQANDWASSITATNVRLITATNVSGLEPPYCQGGAGPKVLTCTLGPGQVVHLAVQVNVPDTAPALLEETFFVTATSSIGRLQNTPVLVGAVDTVIARAVSGDRYVSPNGTDELNNCRVGGKPCASIQQGIETVSVGGIVHVAQGTYAESNLFLGDRIHLQGGWETNFSNRTVDPSQTIVEGERQDRILYISSNSTVESFTLQDGRTDGNGGGIYVAAKASPIISNLILINNEAAHGGGIAIDQGTISLVNSVFFSNTATGDGGGVYVAEGDMVLFNNTIIQNQATDRGGGVFNGQGQMIISNTIVASNTAAAGGGVFGLGQILMDYNDFYQNQATTDADSNFNIGPHSLALPPDLEQITDPTKPYNFDLKLRSPLINQGAPNSTVFVDYKGDNRPTDQGFDIGADELAGCLTQIDKGNESEIYYDLDTPLKLAGTGGYGRLVKVSGHCRGVTPVRLGNRLISQTVFLSKEVSISGGWNSNFSSQSSDYAIIDAQNLGRVLYISATTAATRTIERILFLGGNAAGLGGGFADQDAGGAIYHHTGNLLLNGVVITGGQAALGGGIYVRQDNVRLSVHGTHQSHLLSNTATLSGGGLYNYQGQVPVEKTLFEKNEAPYGAGLYNDQGQSTFLYLKSPEEVMNNRFTENKATENGGGLYNASQGTIYAESTIFLDNTARNGGGLYNASTKVITLVNSILRENNVDNQGGAVYLEAGNPALWHLTFHNNLAENGGGGAIYIASGEPEIVNNIFHENKSNDGAADIHRGDGTPMVRYNLFNGLGGDHIQNINPLDDSNLAASDPGFKDVANADYQIDETSLAFDAGDPETNFTKDFDERPRPGNGGFDMGAYEVGGCEARLNSPSGDPFGNIQRAVDAANEGDTIYVQGRCTGVNNRGGSTQTVYISKTVIIKGEDSLPACTVRDGPLEMPLVSALDKGHVFYITDGISVTISGLQITRGKDGAIYNTSRLNPRLRNNRIYSNTGTTGAAIYNAAGANLIVEQGNCLYGNSANSGAVLYSAGGMPQLINNFIFDNTATDNGAGVSVEAGEALIWHNTFVNNDTQESKEGEVIHVRSGRSHINGNIVTNLEETNFRASSGIHAPDSASVRYNNNTLGLSGGVEDVNNLSEPPLFRDPTVNNYRLQGSSPGIDQGDPDLFGSLDHDFAGDIRPSNQGMDIGADEIPGCYARLDGSDSIYGSAQYAIDLAEDHDTVQIAGVCTGINHRGGLTQTLYISKPLTLEGGWDISFGTRVTATKITPENTANAHAIRLVGSGSLTGTLDRFWLFDTVGGAIYNKGTQFLIKNNRIFNHEAPNGAGIYSENGDLQIWHNTFYNTIVAEKGGGIYIAAGNPTIRNNLFYQTKPTASENGGAIHIDGGTPDEDYNIFWITGVKAIVGVEAGANTQILNDDTIPMFQLPLLQEIDGKTNLQFLALDPDAPAIDVGDAASPVDDDMENQPRPNDVGYDIGADEYAACLVKVPANENLGLQSIFGQLQTAIDHWRAGSTEIYVHGRCSIQEGAPAVVTVSKAFDFSGGWDADFSSRIAGSWTILDAKNLNRTVIVNDNDPETQIEVTFDQFDFINGNAGHEDGGSIYNLESLHLNYSDIYSNITKGNGGGIYSAAPLTVTNVFIENNTAQNGGGIYSRDTLYVSGSVSIAHNRATSNGGGIYNEAGAMDWNGDPLSELFNNEAGDNGGGIYHVGQNNRLRLSGIDGIIRNKAHRGGGIYSLGNVDLNNSIIEYNKAMTGGGIYHDSSTAFQLVNVHIEGNQAQGNGGGFYNATDADLRIFHSKLVANQSRDGSGAAIYSREGDLLVSNTIIISNQNQTNNHSVVESAEDSIHYTNFFNNTPPAVNQGHMIYRFDPDLQTGYFNNHSTPITLSYSLIKDEHSPIIDAGDPTNMLNPYIAQPEEIRKDASATPRPQHYGYDLGWREYVIVHGASIDHISTEGAGLTHVCRASGTQVNVLPSETYTLSLAIRNTGWLTDYFEVNVTPRTGGDEVEWMTTHTLNATIETPAYLFVTSSAGETVAIEGSSIKLGPGEEATIDIVTQVPVDSRPGTRHRNEIAVQSLAYSLTRASLARAKETTFSCNYYVPKTIDIEVGPNNVESAQPGAVITYTQQVTNTGNVSGTVDLFLDPEYGQVIFTGDHGGQESIEDIFLEPGMSETVSIQVTLPEWLAGGSDDVTNIIARVQAPNPGDNIIVVKKETAGINTTRIEYIAGTRHASLNGEDFVANRDTELSNNCLDPLVAPCSLAQALRQAQAGDIIKIAQGTYDALSIQNVVPDQTTARHEIDALLVITRSITLQGGYRTADWEQPRPQAYTTTFTLDKDSQGHVIYITGTEAVTIAGLHIVNGNASQGAGILNEGTSLFLNANVIAHNQADDGAGVYHAGGGILTIHNSVIHNNQGRGVSINAGEAFIHNNTFYQNTGVEGAALFLQNTDKVSITNNIFLENRADNSHQAITFVSSNDVLASMHANIFTNTTPLNNKAYFGPASKFTPNQGNDNLFGVDPLLINPANNDFRLQKGSPAHEAGITLPSVAHDYNYDIRPQGEAYDIGADERLPVLGVAIEALITTDIITNPGVTLVYPYRVTNTGEDANTFQMRYTSEQNWIAPDGAGPMTLTLTSGESQVISVTITTDSEVEDVRDTLIVTATSSTSAAIFDTAQNVTIVSTVDFTLTPIQPSSISGETGQTIIYQHRLENLSSTTNTFDLDLETISSTPGPWPKAINSPASPVTLAGGGQVTINIMVTIPLTASVGDQNVVKLTATSNGLSLSVVNTTQAVPQSRIYLPLVFKLTSPEDTPTVTETATPTSTEILPPTATSIITPSATLNTSTSTVIKTTTPTSTEILPPTATSSPSPEPATATATQTPSPTAIQTPSLTATATPSHTPIPTPTATSRPTLGPGIDLVVTDIVVVPSVPEVGQAVTIRVTIRNQGDQSLALHNNFWTDLFVLSDAAPEPINPQQGDIIWGIQGRHLVAGASLVLEDEYIFNAGGNYRLWAWVDTDNTVVEVNDENNRTAFLVTVNGPALRLEATPAPLTLPTPRGTPTSLPE